MDLFGCLLYLLYLWFCCCAGLVWCLLGVGGGDWFICSVGWLQRFVVGLL